MKLRSLFCCYLAGAGLLFMVLFVNTISYNALSTALEARRPVFTFFPQGWAFFTRNPREGQAILYKLEAGRIADACFRHNHYRFLFGLNRTCTRVYTELSFIRKELPDSAFSPLEWNYQRGAPAALAAATLKEHHIKAPLKDNALQGKYLLIIQEPVPWAWSARLRQISMPAQGIILNITR